MKDIAKRGKIGKIIKTEYLKNGKMVWKSKFAPSKKERVKEVLFGLIAILVFLVLLAIPSTIAICAGISVHGLVEQLEYQEAASYCQDTLETTRANILAGSIVFAIFAAATGVLIILLSSL